MEKYNLKIVPYITIHNIYSKLTLITKMIYRKHIKFINIYELLLQS